MFRMLTSLALIPGLASVASGLGTETFGNEGLSGLNYTDWPDALPLINNKSRVYHRWVNGDESFYYHGDSDALNAALKQFAVIKAEKLTVVLRPGPATTHSFNQEKEIPFLWHLHLVGGIAKHMSTLQHGSEIWSPNPTLHVYVDNQVDLKRIQLPKGLIVLELTDLETRYRKCFDSNDKTVRGWACGHLARLNPYSAESMRRILSMLDDEDDWVKLNAAGALATFKEHGAQAIEKLEAMRSDDKRLQDQAKLTIAKLLATQPDTSAKDAFDKQANRIHEHLASGQNGREETPPVTP